MDFTKADAIMIGRAAQTRPWIFQQINHYLDTGNLLDEPGIIIRRTWLQQHLLHLYEFYGEYQGLRIARKHINWQLDGEHGYAEVKSSLLTAMTVDDQMRLINQFFEQLQDAYYATAC